MKAILPWRDPRFRFPFSSLLVGLFVSIGFSPAFAGDPSDVARLRLEPFFPDSLNETESPHFRLLHQTDEVWAEDLMATLEVIHGRFYRVFEEADFEPMHASDRLLWVCFLDADAFDAYALHVDLWDVSWLDEYYSTRTNQVTLLRSPRSTSAVVPATLAFDAEREVYPVVPDEAHWKRGEAMLKTTHEAAHQLAFNSGLQRRGVMHPFWVSEGLASAFESSSPEVAGFDSFTPSRANRLARMLAAGRMPALEDFVVLTNLRAADRVRVKDAYAMAAGFFVFLYREHGPALRRYMRDLARLPLGARSSSELRAEFVRAFGAPGELENEWRAFLFRELDVAPAPHARD